MDYLDVPFENNKDLSRFELKLQEGTAFVDYRREGDLIHLTHTEVPKAYEGKGVAEVLVGKTFTYLEQHNLRIVPLCSYIRVFLTRHPEWEKLVA